MMYDLICFKQTAVPQILIQILIYSSALHRVYTLVFVFFFKNVYDWMKLFIKEIQRADENMSFTFFHLVQF